MDEIFGLFPIPFMRAPQVLPASLVGGLLDHFTNRANQSNNSSDRLSHTELLRPRASPLLAEAGAMIMPKLVEFGAHLFGERLEWLLKEMWVNVLDRGGQQAMHNHANSFVSGVVYLTPTHPSARTVFFKSPGGTEFLFKNDHARTEPGEFSADKWISPPPRAGDMVLFPSYLMHAVPPNQGDRRVTLAFNAVPTRLNSWDYVIHFT